MKNEIYIILTVQFQKEGNKWTAECREFGTATFGRNLKEAKKRIGEAILVHLKTLDDVNELERFCRENNIIVYSAKPKTISIPISAPLNENAYVQPYIQAVRTTHAHV